MSGTQGQAGAVRIIIPKRLDSTADLAQRVVGVVDVVVVGWAVCDTSLT
jgi:hypothetical protein